MFFRPAQKIISCALKPKLVKLPPPSRTIFTSQPRSEFFNANNDENFNSVSVNVLSRDVTNIILIHTISKFGFRLNSGVFALGPIAVLPTSMYAWTVATHHDINIQSLSLFWLMEPQVDILVIGTGDKREAIDPEIRAFLQSKHISTEIEATQQACSTYNYLAYEKRNVGVALIPPIKVALETPGEAIANQMLKGNFGRLDTKQDKGQVEEMFIGETIHKRQFDKWWSGELKMPFGTGPEYHEQLRKWKERQVDEDDRVSFDQFEPKTERDILEEKKVSGTPLSTKKDDKPDDK